MGTTVGEDACPVGCHSGSLGVHPADIS